MGDSERTRVPRNGDRVRIVCTGPTPGEVIYEGCVSRRDPHMPGFVLAGRCLTTGKDVTLWFAEDHQVRANATPGFNQITTVLVAAP